MSKNTAGPMTTFSVRCWSGQLDRIKAAAEREGKNPPEWILDQLMPATGDALKDVPPLFPEIRRRPSAPPGPNATVMQRAAAKLGVGLDDFRRLVLDAVTEAAQRDRSVSGTRKAANMPRH